MTGVHSSDSLGEGFSQPFQSQYDFDLDHRQIQQPDRFKPMIVQLAQALKPEDVHNLRFCYKHFLKASGSQMNDALEILENLEENGVFTYNNVAPLVGLLKDIQRHDLVSTVENFQSTLLSEWHQLFSCLVSLVYKLNFILRHNCVHEAQQAARYFMWHIGGDSLGQPSWAKCPN